MSNSSTTTSKSTDISKNAVQKPDIFMELGVNHMKEIIQLMDNGNKNDLKGVVIKMGADWCGPCQKIKPLCLACFKHMPPNVICFDIDVDDNMALYSFFKAKRLLNGIPAIFCYVLNKNRDQDKWYIPDMSVLGSDPNQVKNLFKTVFES